MSMPITPVIPSDQTAPVNRGHNARQSESGAGAGTVALKCAFKCTALGGLVAALVLLDPPRLIRCPAHALPNLAEMQIRA